MIKKPWAFIRVPYMSPTILGLQARGFLIRFLHYDTRVRAISDFLDSSAERPEVHDVCVPPQRPSVCDGAGAGVLEYRGLKNRYDYSLTVPGDSYSKTYHSP